MGHAKVENKTPFVFENLFLVDEDFRPLLVSVVKATLTIVPNGVCVCAEQQVPLNQGGELWGEEPEKSSCRYEPEVAFFKPATDIVLNGHAYANRRDTKEMVVGLRVGRLTKDALVVGDRLWLKVMGTVSMSNAMPFEKIPLRYELAFGGWDRDHPDPRKHAYESRNPVGSGFRAAGGFVDGIRLPNIEDPRARIKSLGDRPAPVGFGFISPNWQPRAALAGTYDEAWQKSRAPLLPKDFDRRHLSAASTGLVAPGYLRGDEQIATLGVTPEGRMGFQLPGLPPPVVQATLTHGPAQPVSMQLDTVIIEPDERRVMLFWRGNLPLRMGPHDVREVVASA
jgi:hypothetical protein